MTAADLKRRLVTFGARATVTRVGGALEMWSRAGVAPGVGAAAVETSVAANWVACFRRCRDNLACQSIAVSPNLSPQIRATPKVHKRDLLLHYSVEPRHGV